MSIESIVEAFARGLAQGFVAGPALQQTPPRKRQRRSGRVTPGNRASAASHSSERTAVEHRPPLPQQETIFDVPEVPAPTVTQAELERMERALRGESDGEHYVPDEGVAPWQGS